MTKALKELLENSFDDSFIRTLPGDPESVNQTRQVLGACYSLVNPTPVRAPQIFSWSASLAAELGVAHPRAETHAAIAQVLGGNHLLRGMKPYAACYGGHQFGNWAGQLGDGRAITLGEYLSSDQQRWEWQLKGAGPTPYSRRGDGRAVLRSSMREFLCSEAMHHLGVPSTRALSLVTCEEEIARDMFYDGRVEWEPCAIVTRVAPSFLRFGSFQIFAARGELEILKKLADYTIKTHCPELDPQDPQVYRQWFLGICQRTAFMIAHWLRVGFVHGVMNTDNMSILGLTIDYGPYGWLDAYDPHWTPNTTDAGQRRYRFGQQPQVALWNLAQFGQALLSLLRDKDDIDEGLAHYRHCFQAYSARFMADKLGLQELAGQEDQELLEQLEHCLSCTETDMTLFYRGLALLDPQKVRETADHELIEPIRMAHYASRLEQGIEAQIAAFLRRYLLRVQKDGIDPSQRRLHMNKTNPKYVLRNYLAQSAIEAAHKGDSSICDRLLQVLQNPYDEQMEHDDLAAKRPEWARNKAGCSALSCSS